MKFINFEELILKQKLANEIFIIMKIAGFPLTLGKTKKYCGLCYSTLRNPKNASTKSLENAKNIVLSKIREEFETNKEFAKAFIAVATYLNL